MHHFCTPQSAEFLTGIFSAKPVMDLTSGKLAGLIYRHNYNTSME